MASGSNPHWNDRQLPVGIEEDGFVLRCTVMVVDDIGAAETYFVQEVTVGLTGYNNMSHVMTKPVLAI